MCIITFASSNFRTQKTCISQAGNKQRLAGHTVVCYRREDTVKSTPLAGVRYHCSNLWNLFY